MRIAQARLATLGTRDAGTRDATHADAGGSGKADHARSAAIALGTLGSLVPAGSLDAGRAGRALQTHISRKSLRSLQTRDARVSDVSLLALTDAVLHHTALACLKQRRDIHG